MLGYVTIDKNELKIREYDVYQAYYCGICKSIGRRIGQLPRMVLSYDAVFLALVLSALSPSGEEILREHCIIHPVKKKPVVYGTDAVDYAADVMVILAYHKFRDDWADDRSLAGGAGSAAFAGAYKKLYDRYPEICASVEDALARLSALEKEQCGRLDLVADAFGDILECLFSGFEGAGAAGTALEAGETGEAKLSAEAGNDGAAGAGKAAAAPGNAGGFGRVLAQLGRNLGRWIYVIDALDDYEKDKASGSYNPLIFRKNGLEGIDDLLYNYLAEMALAYDLLDVKKNQGLIENILFWGLRLRTDALLERTKTNEKSI